MNLPGDVGTPPPGGGPEIEKPPRWLGFVLLAVGSFIFFQTPNPGVPLWVLKAAALVFVLGGAMILSTRSGNLTLTRSLQAGFVILFLAILNWVAFGAGDRTGTITTNGRKSIGDVRRPFQAAAVLFDGLLAIGVALKLRGPRPFSRSMDK